MSRIRQISIRNFRCIRQLDWSPSPGINCLIGPGDSGKTSILDAIDFCLGARRNISVTDADFFSLNVEQPITITITIGELSDTLKSLDTYGSYLRSFNAQTGLVEDEPEVNAETVLTVMLTIGSDLEPVWTLVSSRASTEGQSRYLTWSDRIRLSPNRIGALTDYNLAWRRGSVLTRLTDERPDTSAALAKAARDARAVFGDAADAQLGETLRIVTETAGELGIATGGTLKAMLDTHSASFSGGAIALHKPNGVPLRALGVGSTRLLLAGLQRKAAAEASVILIDELEYGLEPHRVIRLLGSIGSKDAPPPLQGFLTTHSPIAIRELSGNQLFVARQHEGIHYAVQVGISNEIQGTIRLQPEAFLAPSVLVCEGASEVGFIRGLDLHYVANGRRSFHAYGVALVDAKGVSQLYARANPFVALGYRVATFRDDDAPPDIAAETSFIFGGRSSFRWRQGRALEDELFYSMHDMDVAALIAKSLEIHGSELINSQLRQVSQNTMTLAACQPPFSPVTRGFLAAAAKSKHNSWYKSVSAYEEIGRDIVGPNLNRSDPGFVEILNQLSAWIAYAG